MATDLAEAGTYVDVAAAQIATAMAHEEPWLNRVAPEDAVALSDASSRLADALTRILSRKSRGVAAKVQDLADLSRQTEEDTHGHGAVGPLDPCSRVRREPLRLR